MLASRERVTFSSALAPKVQTFLCRQTRDRGQSANVSSPSQQERLLNWETRETLLQSDWFNWEAALTSET